jgi:hypothetical protein
LGGVHDFRRQLRFMIFATGEGGACPFFERQVEHDPITVPSFAEFRQRMRRNIDGTLSLVRSIEEPARLLAQAFALAVDCPDERMCIRDGERRLLDTHAIIFRMK